MLKVGIMSMQRIINYGSFLQAYGLKKMIESLGCNVEFVDYHPGKCLIKSDEGKGIRRKLYKVIEVLKYKAPLTEKIKFIRYKKNFAKKYFHYLEIDNTYNYTPKLDILVIGSDEVFNCVQDNTNVGYSPELFGADNRAEKLISYAASFGNTTIEKIKKYGLDKELSNYLNNFNSISVRDNNSGNIVKALIGKEPEYHIDPVLAYDYINLCSEIPNTVSEKNYMVLYGYSGRFTENECEEIRKYADEHRLKILCIGGIQNCCDKFVDCSPFEVIAYFKNADCVVTDTFHGTIFSVITHSKFAVFVRENGYGNSEKLRYLLSRLELDDCIINNIRELNKSLKKNIDYSKTDFVIEEERKKSISYLRRELN